MKEIEEWKDIPGYEYYQVSSYGNVRSLWYNKILLLKPGLRGKYLGVNLCNNKKHKSHNIHVLVAIVFHNHIPSGFKLVVNHKDYNTLNNHKDNLEITTNRENSNQKHLKSSSKYVGVSWVENRSKWRVRIRVKDKRLSLGMFINEDEASKAYQNALLSL